MINWHEIREDIKPTIDWLKEYNRLELLPLLYEQVIGPRAVQGKPRFEGIAECLTWHNGVVMFALVLRSDDEGECSGMVLRHTLVHSPAEIKEADRAMGAWLAVFGMQNEGAPFALIHEEREPATNN
jgi:hypothetical protein